MLKINSEYIEDLIARLSYHSSAIEGNTSTQKQASNIILNDSTESRSKREFYEIENHKYALKYVIESLENDEPIDNYFVKMVHERLTYRLQHDSGKFKTNTNRIVGATFQTTPLERVELELKSLLENTEYRLNISENDEDKLKTILESHILFERIHPFSDGNGRTGRILNIALALKNNLLPIIIYADKRNEYLKFLNDENIEGLCEMVKNQQLEESDIYKCFEYKKNNQIELSW